MPMCQSKKVPLFVIISGYYVYQVENCKYIRHAGLHVIVGIIIKFICVSVSDAVFVTVVSVCEQKYVPNNVEVVLILLIWKIMLKIGGDNLDVILMPKDDFLDILCCDNMC